MIRPAALVTCLAAPAWAQDCLPVPVEPGAPRELPGEPPACYEVPTEAGQRAHLQVVDGPDALFSIDGLAEAQEDYAFVSEGGPLRVRVTSATGAPFVLRLAVEPRADASRAWRMTEGEGQVSGRAWIGAEGGPSFGVSCMAGGPGVGLTYDGLGTAALTRPEAEEMPAVIEIEVGGAARRHSVTLRRIDGFDRYWEVADALGGPLLDDFAAGSTLRLLDAEGSVAGRVDLGGSARLRDAIERRCGS